MENFFPVMSMDNHVLKHQVSNILFNSIFGWLSDKRHVYYHHGMYTLIAMQVYILLS